MADPWKLRLESFAVAFAGIVECLDDKSLEQLRQLREDCDKPDRTNCWCYTYQAAQFLKPMLDERIKAEAARLKRHGIDAE